MTNPYDNNPYDGGTPDNGGHGGSTPNSGYNGDAAGHGPSSSGYDQPGAGDAFNDSPASQGYGADSYGVPMGHERSAAAGGFPSMPDYESSAGTAPPGAVSSGTVDPAAEPHHRRSRGQRRQRTNIPDAVLPAGDRRLVP